MGNGGPEPFSRGRSNSAVSAGLSVSEFIVEISIDTTSAEVAAAALAAGAGIINDISAGRADPEMFALARTRAVPLILMHMQGTPQTMQQDPRYDDVVTEVRDFLIERAGAAIAAGVRRENIVIDPGIGFGKTREHNLQLINRLDEVRALGFPILLGPSRKSFIGFTLDLPADQRVEGTAATVAVGITRGADIIRVHDVKEMARVAKMTDAIVRK